MRKPAVIMILFILICRVAEAQTIDPVMQKAGNLIQDYMLFSRLGPGYSRNMTPDITEQFKALFERDAFLYWDLYLSASDSLHPPMPAADYADLARRVYHNKQPILEYPVVKIGTSEDGKYAIVLLKKINRVLDHDDHLLYKNRMKLRIHINMAGERPLIQNIFEDRHSTFVRSISAGISYTAWSNMLSSLTVNPQPAVGSHEQFRELKITAGCSLQGGVLAELRFNKESGHGLIFTTGLFFSRLPLSSSMKDYSKSYPDTLDKRSPNPLTCTTFERSAEVNEKITITKIEIPLLFKTYINDWTYIKSGTSLGFVSGTTRVNYVLSRTGGGLVTDLTTLGQVYLDEDHELDQSQHGYYRNNSYTYSKEKFLNKFLVSFQFAAGFEKRLGDFSFGLEPYLTFGMNPFSQRSFPGNYQLDSREGFNSILESMHLPAFEFAFGIRLLAGYLFQ